MALEIYSVETCIALRVDGRNISAMHRGWSSPQGRIGSPDDVPSDGDYKRSFSMAGPNATGSNSPGSRDGAWLHSNIVVVTWLNGRVATVLIEHKLAVAHPFHLETLLVFVASLDVKLTHLSSFP